MRHRRSRLRVLAIVGFAACLAAFISGCDETPTSSGDLLDIPSAMARNGVTITNSIAGGSACPSQALADNALHLTVATAADPQPRDVYLYDFRAASFASTDPQVDACVTEYELANGGQTADRIDVAPFRAIGMGWSDDLKRDIQAALLDSLTGGAGQ